nr:CGNR zinc finger domain-containing protein [Auraticoccus cholistanensis]
MASAAALVASDDPDTLLTVDDLVRFVERWQFTGRFDRSEQELAEVRALRPVLRRLWQAEEVAAVELTNQLLAEYRATPQLVRHDHWDWHLHATTPDAPLAARMVVEAAMAFTDVIRSGELDRLRTCAAEDCDNPVLDLSKNRSRRYCDAGCGNRANVAAYRARRSAGQTAS